MKKYMDPIWILLLYYILFWFVTIVEMCEFSSWRTPGWGELYVTSCYTYSFLATPAMEC